MSILRAALVLLCLSCLDMIRPALAEAPDVIWAHNYGSQSNNVTAVARMVTDSAGNLYATGGYRQGTLTLGGESITALGNNYNGFVAKFRPDGTAIWARNIGGATATPSVAGVAVDSAGNVIVAGYFGGGDLTDGQATLTPGAQYDAFMIKYDTDGNRIWTRTFGGSGAQTYIFAIAIDGAGTVIVTGSFKGADVGGMTLRGFQDGFVRRYDQAGTYLDQQQIAGGAGSGADVGPTAIATRGTDIYVAGSFSEADLTSPALSRISSSDSGFMLRYDSSLNNTWRQAIGPSWGGVAGLRVDGSGSVLLAGKFDSTLTTPPLTATPGTWNGYVLKATPLGATTTRFDWATAIGTPGNTAVAAFISDLAIDGTGNAHGVGTFYNGDLSNPAVPILGPSSILLAKFAAADGTLSWSTALGGPASQFTDASGIAVDAGGDVFVAGSMSGSLTTPPLTSTGGTDALMARIRPHYMLTTALAGTGGGTVTADSGGLTCGSACSGRYVHGTAVTLTATPAGGSSFAGWSGSCAGAAAATVVTMSDPRNCTATFNVIPPPPTPPVTIDLAINPNSGGQGRIALGAALGNPGPGAVITVTQAGGGALPGWLVFDRATLTLSFTVPMPETLPFQPSADVKVRAAPPNLIYPPSFLVQTVPLALTVDGRAFAFAMDFHAPRSMTAMTALSYGPTGASGDGASGKPAISWDGGQVLFETAANNLLNAVSAETKVGRYHGLSGKRDLLSQTAVPGGGVANASPGPATTPAVSANGAFGVFAASGGGITLSPSSTLRQIYRTSLVYPRVPLNEAATPAPVMVSTSAAGVPANAATDRPAISEDGNFVAFESAATNLGWNDGGTQIWRKDVTSGATLLVSANAQGTAGNGDSRNVSISWDGRFAAFESSATNLVTGTSGQRIYLKDLDTGAIFAIAPGTAPKLDARATSIVFVASGQVQRFDIATGRVTTLAAGDQPSVSADGRFVAWRAAGTAFTQVWVRDVFRDLTALVSQTATGAQGGGNSYDPALSGDGASIAFGSQARDLVNGQPLPGQIHLAGNPLALPARTGHWHVPSGGNQAWAIERWGDRAYVANLAYRNDGPASWVAGLCAFVDLGCKGTLNPGPLALATWFPVEGTQAVASVNGAANQPLQFYPVLGTATSAMPGLPQAGWWYDPANTGSGVFLQVATQTATDGALSHTAHLSLLGQDNAWYAAEGTLGSDFSLEGTLYAHAGGAAPSATASGPYRLTFAANNRATLRLPDGTSRSLVRFRF